MKTFIFLCCAIAFALGPNEGHSQNAGIRIDKDRTLNVKQVFRLINKQTDYKFIYRHDLIKDAPELYLKKGVIKASTLLEKCLSPIDFTYEFTENNTVVVKRRPKTDVDVPRTHEKYQFQVSGTVLDSNGTPLPGASIVEKGTTNGTTTDFDGNFSMDVGDKNATLIFSYIGFATKEVAVNGQSTLQIAMVEDAAGLDEVVVVGYGSQSRRKITGAVAQVKSAQIADLPVTSFDQALAGQISGVQVSQGTGSPGEASDIKVRGVGTITAGSAPLLVIDGFPSENLKMSDLNPNDIANVQVLKDAASAAIYGSRGSNGVILVSTK